MSLNGLTYQLIIAITQFSDVQISLDVNDLSFKPIK